MFFFLSSLSKSATERAVPSLWLNNWDKENPIIGFWTAAQDSWTIPPEHYPGVIEVRAFDKLKESILDGDSFAIKIDDTIYGDPMLFNSTHLGGAVQEQTGEIVTEYTHYNGTKLPVSITTKYSIIPNCRAQFYTVEYILKPVDSNPHRVDLLDFVIAKNQPETTCDAKRCIIQGKYSDETPAPVIIFAPEENEKSNKAILYVGSDDIENETNPLNIFRNGGVPQTPTEAFNGSSSSAAFYKDLQIFQEMKLTTYRIIARTKDESEKYYSNVQINGASYWKDELHRHYSEFLARGIKPDLIDEYGDLYNKSLIILKNSQNAKIGAIASSLHPRYGYKNWARDSLMAAFMLDAAGYHDEAKHFFEFLPTVERDQNGGWFTTYNTFDGSHEGFVEPQYDSMGLFPMAINFHHQCFGDLVWVKERMKVVEECAEFLMKKGKHSLGLADYAPWEESSDHHIPNVGFPTKYYAFTQGLYYGGLIACAKLEEAFGKVEKAKLYRARAAELKTVVNKYLFKDGKFLRSRHESNAFTPEFFADSASLSMVFAGLATEEQATSHVSFINERLNFLGGGISRYEHDPYFFDSQWNPCGNGTHETQLDMPVWPVTTAYMAWSEHRLGMNFQKRLDFMVKYSAYGNMPIGEAVDRADGALIPPSSPDTFEHGGVYVYTTLLSQGLARSIYSTLFE